MDNFRLVKHPSSASARAGELVTAHGVIPTPVFMPVGSQATVKTLTPDEINTLGARLILCNTYHLYLRPGIEVIKKLGGLHRFMDRDGAILTDSGGYQVFSLSALSKVTDEGVTFRSHIDGSTHFITPEIAVALQEGLGSDIAMVLDEPSPSDAPLSQVRQAMERTHRWAERSLAAHKRADQQLFAIVQGGFSPELRRQSAEYLTSLDFPGYALGGLSLGEPKELTWETARTTLQYLPQDRPRYLMGVGSPEDVVEAVGLGVDMMDCVLPTRVARNGALFTRRGRVNIDNAVFREMDSPVERGCDCYTCAHFSAAYVSHLFRAQELLAYRLATIHNLRFMARLMGDVRSSILNGSFEGFKKDFLSGYQTTDEGVRLEQKQKWIKARKPAID
ncbi:MAG: tRNA guanosine(34) transglycosylase Tgt [Dehalococcoidia bacterium]|nr:MAG: tRNA guanosine(34) transglycosylase Tgt [Dehalococcoidia bacterium]